MTDAVEHRLVHRLQHLVFDTPTALLQRLDSGFQRIGRHAGLHLGILQLCLHQLTVGLLGLSLVHDLLKHLRHGLGQVFLLCLIHFFP